MKEHSYENCHNITCRRMCEKDGSKQSCERIIEELEKILKYKYTDSGSIMDFRIRAAYENAIEIVKAELNQTDI